MASTYQREKTRPRNQPANPPASSNMGMLQGGLYLIGGLGLGAAVMYLLDPQQGSDRRQYLGQAMSDALETTTTSVGSTLGHLGEHASHLAGNVRSRAATVAGNIAVRL